MNQLYIAVSIARFIALALTVEACPRLAVARSDEKFLRVRRVRAILGQASESALLRSRAVSPISAPGGSAEFGKGLDFPKWKPLQDPNLTWRQ